MLRHILDRREAAGLEDGRAWWADNYLSLPVLQLQVIPVCRGAVGLEDCSASIGS